VNKRSRMKTAARSRRTERGFSAIELMIVVAIAISITVMAVLAFQPALKDAQNDAAMRETMDTMRQARQYSITNRRYVQLTFTTGSPSTITATQRNDLGGFGGTNPILFTVAIPGPTTFYLNNTTPDTPDHDGNCAAICIENTSGGPTSILFQSDGELVDATYTAMNGSLFLGVTNQPTTYRAVTILGSTGRVRQWKYNGSAWSQQ